MASKKVTAVSDTPTFRPTIVKRLPRAVTPVEDLAEAGVYRVIHGTYHVPRDPALYLNPDGSDKPHEPKTEPAYPGDEVRLDAREATNLLKMNIVEPLDAKPSRVGKVCPDPTADKKRRGNDPGRAIQGEDLIRATA